MSDTTTTSQTIKQRLTEIANRLASLRLDYELPEDVSSVLAGEIDELNNIILLKPVSVPELKDAAKILVDNPAIEYNRGICELIADLDGIEDLGHCERSLEISKELGLTKNLY